MWQNLFSSVPNLFLPLISNKTACVHHQPKFTQVFSYQTWNKEGDSRKFVLIVRVHCSSVQLNLMKGRFLENFKEKSFRKERDLLVAQHFSTKMKIVGKLPGCSDFCNCSLALQRKLELEIICTRVCVGSGRGNLTMQLHMRRVLQNHKCL